MNSILQIMCLGSGFKLRNGKWTSLRDRVKVDQQAVLVLLCKITAIDKHQDISI